MAKILTEEECNEIRKKKIGTPPGNIFWENYLKTNYIRTDRIGERIKFVRYGNPPENGLSVCYITLAPPYKSYPKLKGMSVFELINNQEIRHKDYNDDMFKRPRFEGEGVIVGWGTDKEPLVADFKIF